MPGNVQALFLLLVFIVPGFVFVEVRSESWRCDMDLDARPVAACPARQAQPCTGPNEERRLLHGCAGDDSSGLRCAPGPITPPGRYKPKAKPWQKLEEEEVVLLNTANVDAIRLMRL